MTDHGNSLALGLQRGVNSISLQCIPWPVACSEWGACLTPKVKIYKNVFPDSPTGHQTTFRDQIWWKSAAAKLPKGPLDYHTKKNFGSAGLVPAPILPKMGRSWQFPERSHPLTCPRVPNLAWIGCVLPDLLRKDWFFSHISNYNIGFQPTNIWTATTTWVRWKKIFKGNWSQLTINVVTIYGSFPLQLKSLPIYLETRREDAWRHESITKAVC